MAPDDDLSLSSRISQGKISIWEIDQQGMHDVVTVSSLSRGPEYARTPSSRLICMTNGYKPIIAVSGLLSLFQSNGQESLDR